MEGGGVGTYWAEVGRVSFWQLEDGEIEVLRHRSWGRQRVKVGGM